MAAFLLGLAVTAPFFVTAIRLIRYAASGRAVDSATMRGLVSIGVPTNAAGNALLLSGLAFLAVSSLCLLTLVGVLDRRRWGREGTMGFFGLLTLVVTPVGLAGVFADPPGRNAWSALLVAAATAGVVALLLHRATADEFERVERERRNARHHRRNARHKRRSIQRTHHRGAVRSRS